MALQKGSKITARADSAVNVLEYPNAISDLLATFKPSEHVGYATTDEIYQGTNGYDISEFIEVFYFSENTFLPVAIGYVDKDSVEIGEPETDDSKAPVKDEKGNTLPESKRNEGAIVKDPKTGEKTVIVPSESPAAAQSGTFPTWAKWTIIGIAVVLTIVSGVWIYGQYKKSQKGKKP